MINELVKVLETDPAYRDTWKANIAVCFMDAWRDEVKRVGSLASVHVAANNAAEQFIKLLCTKSEAPNGPT